ncbi:uncharacterized protein N7483_004169 [Penicillium malachiteum]|uniref:uncharacterized protein n=1 Tax=Penicillium malachiteum TaxID=1324776 RepID=UPI002548F369|nr:uncharacterized protein N7483_004169 [Penicillium malachiteum]KAJ5729661.1 hypothetical protein N7483_004169 [Penicillium malachiteum]
MNPYSSEASADINSLAEFLADSEVSDLSSVPPVDCIILCASQVLYGAEMIFETLRSRPGITKYLVLCGGIGHSTALLYDSVTQHNRYSALADRIQGLPEARVLENILDEFFDRARITAERCQILVEDRSTNCGQNAMFSRQILEQAGVVAPKTCIISQDPTMMLRTKASFEKTYQNLSSPVCFLGYPGFVPSVQLRQDEWIYTSPAATAGLWTVERFLELILGEVPRLRDGKDGYGPEGRNFISHVDIPPSVEMAWSRLSVMFKHHKLR